jgi:hypothetical protein
MRTHLEAASRATTQCHHTNQHIPLSTNQSPGGNGSSTSRSSLHEHQIMSTTNQRTTTFMATRLRSSSHETGTISTRHGPPITTHHTPGEQSQSSYGSHGCRHGQATHLQTINEKHKVQRSMESFISQRVWKISSGHRPPTLSRLYFNTKFQQNG